ncbi:MAG: VPLPA-CTERM sorting domain-containing protein [Dinoroseobacter sp.]|nr:VPLPA-CTERM sorting domain-containing protein [Dinoroseobacter sp.]
MPTRLIALLIALAASATGASAATTQIFSDAGEMQAALAGFSEETFSNQVGKGRQSKSNPHGTPEVFDYGTFTITKTYSRNGYGSDRGSWRGKPTSTAGDIITFDSAIRAWGADILTGDGGGGVGIRVFADDVYMGSVGTGSDPNNAFFGFISNTPVTSLRLVSGFRNNGRGGADGYRLDNMTYGNVAVMPLPAGAWLILTGMGGLALARRRKKRTL